MTLDDPRFRRLGWTRGAERDGRTFDVTLWVVPGGFALELAEHGLTYAHGLPTLILDDRHRVNGVRGFVTPTYLAVMADALADHVERTQIPELVD